MAYLTYMEKQLVSRPDEEVRGEYDFDNVGWGKDLVRMLHSSRVWNSTMESHGGSNGGNSNKGR